MKHDSSNKRTDRELGDFLGAAQMYCAGPQSIDMGSGSEKFYGRHTLSLLAKSESGHLSEIRAAYLDPYDTDQKLAVLRIAQWRRNDLRRWFDTAIDRSNAALGGKYIPMDAATVLMWVAELSGVSAPVPHIVPKLAGENGHAGIRLIWQQNRFEWQTVWHVDDPEYESLTLVWRRLWKKMDVIMRNQPILDGVAENYWSIPAHTRFELRSDDYGPINLIP